MFMCQGTLRYLGDCRLKYLSVKEQGDYNIGILNISTEGITPALTKKFLRQYSVKLNFTVSSHVLQHKDFYHTYLEKLLIN